MKGAGLVLALDIGTSGARALLVSDKGAIVSAAARPYAVQSPRAGWAEQSPQLWWDAVVPMVRELLSGDPSAKERVSCVGLSGQMHGTVCLDKMHRVIRPCMLWCDGRASRQVDLMRMKLSPRIQEQVLANPILAGFPAPKLLWLKETEPDHYQELATLLLPKDYVRLRLTGEIATDVSDASGTLFFDVERREWAKDVLSALDLDPAVLPPAYESAEVTAHVSREAAEETGLRAGTAVIAGAGDAVAATAGAGVTEAGKALCVLGTGGNVTVFSDTWARDPKLLLNSFCGCIPRTWVLLGVQQSAGLSLRWLRDCLRLYASEIERSAGEDAYDVMLREASEVPPGSGGAIFLPYLMGERTPHMDPHARGAFVGLTARHSRAHLVRAALEGVAFAMRDTIEIVRQSGIPVAELCATGGGAKSRLWLQVQADVLASAVSTLNVEEGSAFGAALLACVASGFFGSVEDACKATLWRTATYQPRPEAGRVYEELYAEFRKLYPALRDSFHRLSESESAEG